ncbi:MAG: GNAT family N-acetyltransferase [Spirosoma sp.]|nr:GNAT family N-acetyltransferase [Spirosoma sp.]
MLTVLQISSPADLETAFAIRRAVFVEEQRVDEREEYDEYETVSHHFLSWSDAVPCGTARWRRTSNGVKMERFAVLKDYRGQGVGKALVRAVLDNIFRQQPEPIESIYLHAQLSAIPLYTSFGFVTVGSQFEEAGIQHCKMVLPGSAYQTQ